MGRLGTPNHGTSQGPQCRERLRACIAAGIEPYNKSRIYRDRRIKFTSCISLKSHGPAILGHSRDNLQQPVIVRDYGTDQLSRHKFFRQQ